MLECSLLKMYTKKELKSLLRQPLFIL